MKEKWYELGPFTVFDVETTGMSAQYDRIVELAALRVSGDGSTAEYHTLIHPERSIPSAVSAIHHITDEMVADAPLFPAVGNDFLEFAAGTTLVAHNARFDLGFLQESLARSGLPLWRGPTLDSLKLVKTLRPGLPSYRLQYLRTALKLDAEGDELTAHRAGDDVVWTMRLLQQMLEFAIAGAEAHA